MRRLHLNRLLLTLTIMTALPSHAMFERAFRVCANALGFEVPFHFKELMKEPVIRKNEEFFENFQQWSPYLTGAKAWKNPRGSEGRSNVEGITYDVEKHTLGYDMPNEGKWQERLSKVAYATILTKRAQGTKAFVMPQISTGLP